jgi:hypothetical protein
MEQSEITNSFLQNYDNLSVSYDTQAPTEGALSAMKDTTKMVVIPDDSDIELPPLPEITTTPSQSVITRMYRAV